MNDDRRIAPRTLWLSAAALLALLLVGGGLVHGHAPASASRARIEVLREAFDRASAHCYAVYEGAELRGCLIGAMQAHLQALSGRAPPAEPPEAVGVGAPRGDV